MPLTLGTQVGRYRVIRMIAQGGMAEVYRAEQELSAGIYRPAALKVIRPEYAESADFREMFLDEARTACALSHPHIVHIYEVGDSDGRLFMAMELVPGETVATVARKLRERGERFADEGLLAIGVFTCSALEAVHALSLPGEGHVNLVHRDVSPHNLLLGPTGSLKLIDFGIAKAVHNRNLTSPGVTKGKAGYFSPEQAMGKALDGRSDLFSLGVMLYKLAYGATPFDEHKDHHSRNTALVHGRWLPLRQVCAGLPPGFYDVVDRALQVRPEDRWPDARAMREALERVALESGVSLGPSSLAYYVQDQDDSKDYTGSSQRIVSTPQPSRPAPSTALRQLTPAPVAPVEGATAETVAEGGKTVLDAPERPSDTTAVPPRLASARRSTVQIRASRPEPAVPGPRRTWLLAGGAAAAFLLALGGGLLLFRGNEQSVAGDAGVAAEAVAVGNRALVPGDGWEAPSRPADEAAELLRGAEGWDASAGEALAAPLPAEEAQIRATPPAPAQGTGARGAARGETRPARASSPPKPSVERNVAVRGGPEGLLRVGAEPDGQARIPGQAWEATPLNRKVPAGRYRVELRSPSGKKGSCEVNVLADRRVILRYDFATGACAESQY